MDGADTVFPFKSKPHIVSTGVSGVGANYVATEDCYVIYYYFTSATTNVATVTIESNGTLIDKIVDRDGTTFKLGCGIYKLSAGQSLSIKTYSINGTNYDVIAKV